MCASPPRDGGTHTATRQRSAPARICRISPGLCLILLFNCSCYIFFSFQLLSGLPCILLLGISWVASYPWLLQAMHVDPNSDLQAMGRCLFSQIYLSLCAGKDETPEGNLYPCLHSSLTHAVHPLQVSCYSQRMGTGWQNGGRCFQARLGTDSPPSVPVWASGDCAPKQWDELIWGSCFCACLA